MGDARSEALRSLNATLSKGAWSNLQVKGAQAPDRAGRALYKRLFFGVLERKNTLDYVIARHSRAPVSGMSPTLVNCLRLGVYQLLYCDGIPPWAAVNETVALARRAMPPAAGLVNAVLKAVANEHDPLGAAVDPAVIYSVDPSVALSLERDYGTGARDAFLASLYGPSPIYARVNTRKTDSDALIETLKGQGVTAKKTALDNCLTLDLAAAAESLPAYRDGLFHLQGYASQAACAVLDPRRGQAVLDLCSAPGCKAFTCAQQTGAPVTAFDLHPHRVELVRTNAARLGLDVRISTRDASAPFDAPEFERVMCDVPCSGLGMMGKHPEIRYKDLADSSGLPALQLAILLQGAAHTAPGGRLLYSTCTLTRAENEAVTDAFLAARDDFSPVAFEMPAQGALPGAREGEATFMEGEGFYIALLGRAE